MFFPPMNHEKCAKNSEKFILLSSSRLMSSKCFSKKRTKGKKLIFSKLFIFLLSLARNKQERVQQMKFQKGHTRKLFRGGKKNCGMKCTQLRKAAHAVWGWERIEHIFYLFIFFSLPFQHWHIYIHF